MGAGKRHNGGTGNVLVDTLRWLVEDETAPVAEVEKWKALFRESLEGDNLTEKEKAWLDSQQN